jgi:murein L,D-transpeptidase YafK
MAVAAGGCGFDPLARFRPAPPPAPVAQAADDDDHVEWAASEPYAVVVRKSCRTLDVYRYGQRIRSFPAVFGLNGLGRKLFAGDLRTPIGLYSIVDKHPHKRWGHFLLLDYPNLEDRRRYWTALEEGDIPRAGKSYASIGGAVGIHGTDKPSLNARNVDWTWGCISIPNQDIDDLTGLVPVGTLVLIED